MFINGINAVHFEPTARCNAKCPMCSRTGNSTILNNQGEISIKRFRKFFSPKHLKKIQKWKFCGNFGDPIIAKDLIEMHEEILIYNSDAEFILSTNGGIRSESFWKELGKIYNRSNEKSCVEFHIDGLEDTNHIYRIGVKWDKLIRNAKAYNSTNAKSSWFFIPFFHNEHQVEEAEKLSVQLGFNEFVVKISTRFPETTRGFYGNGAKLFPPIGKRFQTKHLQTEGKLVCFAEERKEIFVDAWGRFFPCCWTASRYTKIKSWSIHKNEKMISLDHRSIDDIISDPKIDEWIQSLYQDTTSVCNKRCTGKYQHVLDFGGEQRPQKDMWGVGSVRIEL